MGRQGIRCWGALLALLWSVGAWAGGKVVLLVPRGDKDVLAPVAALLSERGLEPVGEDALRPAMKALRLKAKDLGNEAKVTRLAREVGASGFVLARQQGRPRDASLAVAFHDAQGKRRWSQAVKLQKLRLSERSARQIADGIAGQLPEAVAKPEPEAPAPPAPPKVAEPTPEPVLAPPVAPPVADAPKVDPARPLGSEVKVAQAPAPQRPTPDPVSVSAPAAEVAAPSNRSAAIPLLEVGAGGVALWRTHEFCPGVVRCGQKSVSPGTPVRYYTPAPYLGPSVRASVFPLAWWDSPLRGLGLTGSYARGFLQTLLPDATGQTTELPTYDESFSAELVYRFGFKLGWGEPSVGLRGGLVGRRFVLPDNSYVTESRRRNGPLFGAEAALPLREPYVRLEVSARYAPASLPGNAERQAYGGDQVTSSGLLVTAGISGQFDEGWGYVLMGELTSFTDTFSGTGERANGGAAHEEYVGVVGLIRYRF